MKVLSSDEHNKIVRRLRHKKEIPVMMELLNGSDVLRYLQVEIRKSSLQYHIIAKLAGCSAQTISRLAYAEAKDIKLGTAISIIRALDKSVYVGD